MVSITNCICLQENGAFSLSSFIAHVVFLVLLGLWLGVEWDNPARGRHDGSHEGTVYFKCR